MKRTFCLVLAFLAGACGLTRPPEINVEDQWQDALRRLNLFSLYPSTEDALPGDVYLVVPPPYGVTAALDSVRESIIPGSRPAFDGTRFSIIRLGSVGAEQPGDVRRRRVQDMNMLDHIEEQQLERPRIQSLPPVTPPPPPAAQPGAAPPTGRGQTRDIGGADSARIGHADQNTTLPRLQRSAIPSLTVARITEAQLGAAGVLGNFGLSLLSSSGGTVALTITLRDVQELPLEPWRARLLLEERGGPVFAERITPNDLLYWLQVMRAGRRDTHSLMRAACTGDAAALARQGVQVAVVTRVVYAGAIEYSFSRRTAEAIRSAVDLQGATATHLRAPPQIPTLVVTVPTTTQGAAAGQPPAQPAAPPSPLEALRAELATRVSAATGMPGGANARAGLQSAFGIGTLGSLSLTEIFNRPVAVGFGSRLILSFHDALAGVDPGRIRDRFEDTVRICRTEYRELTQGERDTLWALMRDDIDPQALRRELALPRATAPAPPRPGARSPAASLAAPARPQGPPATESIQQRRSPMRGL
jgi:hypothetical protein